MVRVLIWLGLMMNPLVPTVATASDHIRVTREILLESGLPAQPQAIVRTHEGGYVVAGMLGLEAWATRIAPDGKVQWRHTVPKGSARGGMPRQEYTGAAMLQDDSAILCGFKEIDVGTTQDIVGILTHIDKTGRVVSERQIYPNGDKNYKTTYLRRCSASAEGVVVSGTATRVWGTSIPREGKMFDYSIVIDERGTIASEKLTDGTPVPDQSTETVLRLSGTQFENPSRIVALAKANKILAKKAFYLPDRSVALFGHHYVAENAFSASVTRISADLSRAENFVFQPIRAAIWITDAVRTDDPWEFATVRPVLPVRRSFGPDETRMGAALAFVRFK